MLEKYSNEIHHILNTFYRTTGVGALYFDDRLTLVACQPSKTLADEFICLGTNRLTSSLTEKLALEPKANPVFYTYSLNGNLICNIVLLAVDDIYIGAFVMQPVFFKTQSPADIEALLTDLDPASKNRDKLSGILKKMPVRSFESIAPLGETLSGLVYSVFNNMTASQVLCGDVSNNPEIVFEDKTGHQDKEFLEDLPVRHVRFLLFLKIMECIKTGDSKLMSEIVADLNSSTIPTHHLDRADYMRSLKDSYIKVCMFACYSAIDSNAPFYKTLDLADELIRRMEKLESAIDIFELMKETLLDFVRVVEVSRLQSHSKPIRLVLDFIHEHFSEKITLEMLAELTGLSTFYLSTLIKKETGLMLMDNINSIRVEESKKLLHDENNSIIDVAQQVGFAYQNHYSTVFKKFTGLSPTEYIKSKKTHAEEKGGRKQATKPAPIVVDQLRNTLLSYPEIYDAARIVEPNDNLAWAVKTVEDDILPETCYDFWKRGRSCANCISKLAYLKNRVYFKVDQINEDIFLVAAIPKTIGKNTYVVEVIKKVSNDIIFDVDEDMLKQLSAEVLIKTSFFGEERNTICCRKEIDELLPVYIRLSKLEKVPFSLILIMPGILSGESNLLDRDVRGEVIRQFEHVITSVISGNGYWAGQYTGDIFLLALKDTNYENACRIAEKIKFEFEKMDFYVNGKIAYVTVSSGVTTLTDDIADENAIVNDALSALDANNLAKQQ